MGDDALAYAKEVYAACATVGFDGDIVRQLKALLDASDQSPPEVVGALLLRTAMRAQAESIEWVEGRHE